MATNTVKYVTPIGTAHYPWLNEPDTKFNPEGVYKVNMTFDKSPELDFMLKDLDKMLEDFYQDTINNPKNAKVKAKIQKADLYETVGEDLNKILIKFKQNAVIKSIKGTFNAHIAIFDSKGKPCQGAKIGGGSRIKICFTAAPYYVPSTRVCGLTLRPVAVQVIELKDIGGASAESYGFSAEEGGFEYSEEPESPFDSEDPMGEEAQEASNF